MSKPMDHESFKHNLETIQQGIHSLSEVDAAVWQESRAALERLQLLYEEMQTTLEVSRVVEEELLQQNYQLASSYQYYHDLFQDLLIGYLVTDADGVILEANRTIAQLLNVPHRFLAGKPLILYIAEGDRSAFSAQLTRLSRGSDMQIWSINFSPRSASPFEAELFINVVRDRSETIKELRIGVYHKNRSQPQVVSQDLQPQKEIQKGSWQQLPQSLNGLKVLIVDDEADAREFIAAALQLQGIGVRTVASAAAALEELKHFRPDVLMSDIRMPNGDGYSLIRQIRELEAGQGGHLPAAAITAYLDEDREKALRAGFEAHLHKLAQPTEFVEVVVQLARQT